MKFIAHTVALLLAATPALHAQLQVPQDYATIREAVAAAAPNDTIVVTGGEHIPFVIDKPLTLIGSASDRPLLRCYFTGQEFQSQPQQPANDPPVRLAGPGFGSVTISGFDFGGEFFWEYQVSTAAIEGSGFDELRVLHCDVVAPEWSNYGNPTQSPGIDVDVPYLLVSDSRVVGGKPGWNAYYWMWVLMPGGAGIRSTGDIDLFDTEVIGGEGYDNTYWIENDPPTECGQVSNGEGGTGVVTPGTLRVSRSEVLGGPGAVVKIDDGSFPDTFLCQLSDGEVMEVGEFVELDESLVGDGALVPFTKWELQSTSQSREGALLLVSLEPIAPISSSAGSLYMPADSFFLRPIANGETSQLFNVRDDSSLAGATVVMQRYDLSQGALSNPVHATFIGE